MGKAYKAEDTVQPPRVSKECVLRIETSSVPLV